jgi:glutathione S-transferase
MMMLRQSPASPYARKVRIAAAVLGLADRIELVAANTNDPEDPLRKDNPLGKIPTMVLENGVRLYDSPVIVEYLDMLAGGGKIIPAGEARFKVLTLEALADGILDASLLQVYEGRYRSEDKREPSWVELQSGKVSRSLAALEHSPPASTTVLPDVGCISVACVLGYQDLRFEGKWRAGHPKLVAWLDAFAMAVPSFEETRFKG